MKEHVFRRHDDTNERFHVKIRLQAKPSPDLTCLNDEHCGRIQTFEYSL